MVHITSKLDIPLMVNQCNLVCKVKRSLMQYGFIHKVGFPNKMDQMKGILGDEAHTERRYFVLKDGTKLL